MKLIASVAQLNITSKLFFGSSRIHHNQSVKHQSISQPYIESKIATKKLTVVDADPVDKPYPQYRNWKKSEHMVCSGSGICTPPPPRPQLLHFRLILLPSQKHIFMKKATFGDHMYHLLPRLIHLSSR